MRVFPAFLSTWKVSIISQKEGGNCLHTPSLDLNIPHKYQVHFLSCCLPFPFSHFSLLFFAFPFPRFSLLVIREMFHSMPREVIKKCEDIFLERGNYIWLKSQEGAKYLFTNSSNCLVQRDETNKLTTARTKAWFVFSDKLDFVATQKRYLSLYRVVFYCKKTHNNPDGLYHGEVDNENVSKIKCSCQKFYTSGYFCSHILAGMHLANLINVHTLMGSLSAIPGSGRPLKRLKCLRQMSPFAAVRAEEPINFVGQQILSTCKLFYLSVALLLLFT